MVHITRIEHFNAAHKLYNPSWSKAENEVVFGKCANENWHGHNFELHVTIAGNPNPDTGFVFDVKKLSLIIKEFVIENLIIGIWAELLPNLPTGIKLYSLKLYETPRIYVEYFGQ